MTISLADNLFANANASVGKSAAAKKTQAADKAKDTLSPFITENQNASQTLAQKTSVDDAAKDFGKTLAKKTAQKQSVNQTTDDDSLNNEQEIQTTDNSVIPQELLAMPAVQIVDVAPDADAAQAEQVTAADDSVQLVADALETPADSQTKIQKAAIELENEPILPTEQPTDEIVSENPQAIAVDENQEQTAAPEILQADIETENQTEITEEIQNNQLQFNVEELTTNQESVNVNIEMPETAVPAAVAPVVQNQQDEQTANSDENSDSDISIDVEADTTLKDILSEIQTATPDSTENSTTVSQMAENAESDFDDLSVEAIEPDAQQTADANANNNSILTSLQSLVAEDSHISKVSATADTHKAGNTNSTASIASQIQYNVQSSLNAGSNEIVIQLNPPELGRVEVKFTEDSAGLTGVLSVDKPMTKYEIQQSLPEIIQNLKEGGVDIKKIEVVLANQQEQQSMHDNPSAGQNNWSWQQNSPNQHNSTGTNIYSQWNPAETSSYNPYSSPDMHYSEDSVNMLV
jgi:hypothetical protein